MHLDTSERASICEVALFEQQVRLFGGFRGSSNTKKLDGPLLFHPHPTARGTGLTTRQGVPHCVPALEGGQGEALQGLRLSGSLKILRKSHDA